MYNTLSRARALNIAVYYVVSTRARARYGERSSRTGNILPLACVTDSRTRISGEVCTHMLMILLLLLFINTCGYIYIYIFEYLYCYRDVILLLEENKRTVIIPNNNNNTVNL